MPLQFALSLRKVGPRRMVARALGKVLAQWRLEVETSQLPVPLEDVLLRGGEILFGACVQINNCAALVHRFAVRLAKRINRLLRRRGRVFRERYRVLTPPFVPPPPTPWKTRVAEAAREQAEVLAYTLLWGAAKLAGGVISRRHRI